MRIMMGIINFYVEGFKEMRVGKKLWGILAIKFIIFFVVMKYLFFPNIMKEHFSDDKARATYILENLTTQGER